METGTVINQYRIISPVGKGGMGEVFLAHDTRLDRKVAIKFLSEEFSRDADKLSRFVREAKAASALNHPNILTVHEIGENDGREFIVTEFIEGRTLRQQLVSKNAIPLDRILKIGVQVAEALSAAHQAGIIHRDIKPENIMIRKDGYAKVLDFGLAKLSEPPASAGGPVDLEEATKALVNTHPGMVMGTVSYMSPEQAKGTAIDARTDIWSLAVVLYEMLAGKVPFTGETINHTIVSILENEPMGLENVPDELQRIVRKSLAKDPDMRYQTARDLLIDLKNLRRTLDIQGELKRSAPQQKTPATGEIRGNETEIPMESTEPDNAGQAPGASAGVRRKRPKAAAAMAGIVLMVIVSGIAYFGFFANRSIKPIASIAVLPFENKNSDDDTDYLSDGLAESLIFRLTQIPDLKVSPTSSVMRYKGKETDVSKIASELGVDAVMTGRVTKRGDNLTITVELVDARTNKSLWGERYERKLSELLTTQREIAAEITNKLELKLSGAGEQRQAKKYTDSNEAYQLYLRGRFHYAKRTDDDVLKGIDYFRQAIKLDPNFALAYATIAESFNSLGKNAYLPPKEVIPKANEAAQRALEIDPTLAEAHGSLADSLALYDWNWAESEREYAKAFQLDPNVSYNHQTYGLGYLVPMGKRDQAIAELQRAAELEPLSLISNAVLCLGYLYVGQNDKAFEQGRKTIDLDPGFRFGRHYFGYVYIAIGRYDDAIALAEKGLKTTAPSQQDLAIAGLAYAKSGKKREADEYIGRFRELGKTRYVRTFYLAEIYAALGEKDKALAELEKSFEDRDCYLPRMSMDPFFDTLRDEPRFKDLLKRMGLPV